MLMVVFFYWLKNLAGDMLIDINFIFFVRFKNRMLILKLKERLKCFFLPFKKLLRRSLHRKS